MSQVNVPWTTAMIVEDWLKTHGLDGLISEGGCGCRVGNLMPCGKPGTECATAKSHPCVPNDECECDEKPKPGQKPNPDCLREAAVEERR